MYIGCTGRIQLLKLTFQLCGSTHAGLFSRKIIFTTRDTKQRKTEESKENLKFSNVEKTSLTQQWNEILKSGEITKNRRS